MLAYSLGMSIHPQDLHWFEAELRQHMRAVTKCVLHHGSQKARESQGGARIKEHSLKHNPREWLLYLMRLPYHASNVSQPLIKSGSSSSSYFPGASMFHIKTTTTNTVTFHSLLLLCLVGTHFELQTVADRWSFLVSELSAKAL